MFDLFDYRLVGTMITLHNGNNTVTERYIRGEAHLYPCVTDAFIMCRVVEGEVLEFIIPCGTKSWIILGELCQEFIEFFLMHKTETPLVNVSKDVLREGIKLLTNFRRTGIFIRESGDFKGGMILVIEEGRTSYELDSIKFTPS